MSMSAEAAEMLQMGTVLGGGGVLQDNEISHEWDAPHSIRSPTTVDTICDISLRAQRM